MYKKITILLFFILCFSFAKAQYNRVDSVQKIFDKAYTELENMLNGKQKPSFKYAVYLVENAYYNDSLDYDAFLSLIDFYKKLTLAYNKANKMVDYKFADSTKQNLNASLFKIFTDTIKANDNQIVSYPFQYNFDDALGSKDLSSTFISNLMVTKKGNCHSLPYLYKILTEELGTTSYLALAPMHIYIKQFNKKVGWYNVELTSGHFPLDGYLMATGYISHQNIVSKLYMDTLSYKESIATCVMDLCYAYMRRLDTLSNTDFIMKCANKSLEIKPNYISGLLRLNKINEYLYIKYTNEHKSELAQIYKQGFIDSNKKLIKLGYQDVSKETFSKWYTTYQKDKSKYDNPEINTNFKSTKAK